MRVQPQALEADLGGMEMEEGYGVSAGDNFRKRTLDDKVGADGGVRVMMM